MSGSFDLPAFIDVNGAWEDVRDRLYTEFEAVFKCVPPRQVQGLPLVYDARTIDDAREEGFWHVITKGKPENRFFDTERARRISYIAPILDGTAPALIRWRYIEGDGSTRLYFWLKAAHYVLILQEQRTAVALVTAFFVERWGERDLDKKLSKGVPF